MEETEDLGRLWFADDFLMNVQFLCKTQKLYFRILNKPTKKKKEKKKHFIYETFRLKQVIFNLIFRLNKIENNFFSSSQNVF